MLPIVDNVQLGESEQKSTHSLCVLGNTVHHTLLNGAIYFTVHLMEWVKPSVYFASYVLALFDAVSQSLNIVTGLWQCRF